MDLLDPQNRKIALLVVFIDGTRDISDKTSGDFLLYEKPRNETSSEDLTKDILEKPVICTLPGGKAGAGKNDFWQNLTEDRDPYWAALREWAEETGPKVRPQNIQYAFTFLYPQEEGPYRQVYIYTASISEDEVKLLIPAEDPNARFVRCNADMLKPNPLDNDPPISLMNLAALDILFREGSTGEVYTSDIYYPSIRQFQNDVAQQRLMQSSL